MKANCSRAVLAGLGGFGAKHLKVLHALEERGVARLEAGADPNLAALRASGALAEWEAKGAAFFEDLTEALRRGPESDFAIIAAPIPCHRSLHEECVRAGKPVYLEKPPTLDPEDLAAMIEADRGARRRTQVGFNYVYQPERQEWKRRMLAGDFGAVRSVRLCAFNSRPTEYYKRASWSGRLFEGNALVLDCCLGNAMAHHVHNLLFFAGIDGLMRWGEPEWLESELYRANRIQSADTMFIRGRCANGVELRIAASHAHSGPAEITETVVCEAATLRFSRPGHFRIDWADGETETHLAQSGPEGHLAANLEHYAAYLRGERERVLTTLEDSRPFVELVALAFLSFGVPRQVPEEYVRLHREGDAHDIRCIRDVERMGRVLLDRGLLPSEVGAAWAKPGTRVGRTELDGLREKVAEMTEV